MIGNRLRYFLILFLTWNALGLAAYSQNAVLQALVSKTTVSEGERFRLEYKFNGSGDEFAPPKFEGFRILSGPNQSTSMQFINGRSSYSISYSYVLMALKEGNYTIPAATIKSGANIISSNELNINVLKGSAKAQNDGNSAESKSGGNSDIERGLFIKATVNNTEPYLGEQLIVTYKLYFNYNIVDNSFTTLPSLNGFWSEDIDIKTNTRDTEVLNGVRYNVATLKSAILVPQRSGDLEIDPLSMDLVIQQPIQSNSRSLFDQFFGNYKNVKVSVSSKPLKIKVKDLPSGKPAGFDGAVGDYQIKLKADRTEVMTNEAINVSIEFSGKGNLKILTKPTPDFPSDFEVYDPKVKDNISSNASGMSGSRYYEYLIIPRHKGDYTLNPISFSYFNPRTSKYVTLNTGELQFKIQKGQEDATNSESFVGTNKEEIKLLGSDIRFIKTNTVLSPMNYSFFGSVWHYILWLLPLPLFILARKLKQRYTALRNDEVYMRRSKASKMAEKRLSAARKIINSGNDKQFYEEIFKAMYGFIIDKFNIPQSEINKDRIREKLNSVGINQDLISRTEELLTKCEMARFAPVNEVSHEDVYNEASVLLSSIQKQIK